MSGRIINVDNNSFYIEYNNPFPDKPTVVFLHDSLGAVELWRDFPSKLGKETGCNILVYDRIGYGKSSPMSDYKRDNNYMEVEADTLNNLLEKLKISDVILFGHSDGGSIALIMASKYPQKIRATICEAGHIFVEDITLEGIEKALNAYRTTNLPERLKKYHGNKVEDIVKAWTETWLNDKFRSWNIECFLKNITSPLLFIQGENDEYGTLDQVEKTIFQVKGTAEKFVIPHVGHTPHKEIPDVVLVKAVEFIKKQI